jgi:hypothetical protein
VGFADWIIIEIHNYFAVVFGSSLSREEELKSLVNHLLEPSESSLRDQIKRGWEAITFRGKRPSLSKRGWEAITFRGKRPSLSKRGWEALPLYRRRKPYLKRAWETHIVKLPGKRPSLSPFIDTDRFPDPVEPSCCDEESYACCQLCNTGVNTPMLVLNPSSLTRQPCQCCAVSEEFCSLCSVMW